MPKTATEYLEEMLSVNNVGDPNIALGLLTGAMMLNNVSGDLIVSKWKEYNDMCISSGMEQRYRKSIDSFLEGRMWQRTFKNDKEDSGTNWHIKMQTLLKDQNMDI